MRISRVSYGFTKNLGNYQSRKAEVTVEVAEDESFIDGVELAKAAVEEIIEGAETLTPEARTRRAAAARRAKLLDAEIERARSAEG